MRRPIVLIQASETVLDGARLMREADVGFLPVVDPRATIVGVLTDREIVTRVTALGLNPPEAPVSSAMTSEVVTCSPGALVSRAEALMRRHRLTRIVVVDEGRVPIGVLSLSDIAQYAQASRVGHTVQAVSERKYGVERP
jgi:CBS domain-containing protein